MHACKGTVRACKRYSFSVEELTVHFCGEKERTIILCGMWSLWGSRNDRKHGKAPIDAVAAVNWALDVCFYLTSVQENAAGSTTVTAPQRWQRPPVNSVKINVDGAFVDHESSGGIGAVARDDMGEFLLATTRRLPAVASALAAEAEALRAGVQLIA